MADQPEQQQAHPSTKPYLIRAIYEWCTDNGFTPYLAVVVDASTRVPMEFVKDGQIVLNISFEATNGLKMGNDFVEFAARFGGVQRDIQVPIERVAAIYARENGHGQGFEVSDLVSEPKPEAQLDATTPAATPGRPAPGGKPKLTVVK
ncbi:MAG TPA: ClpXP protease specificity-enhancing factor [Burkholderiales bacterium]|jgi:stringent starvation protein B|nr:ClpXP protease specificity-enhancing factor [Burkholderiales bacterium]